jgi:ectoine hydroxylase-related dioxygenase (phytanoyl-CoA dioxygenase family)
MALTDIGDGDGGTMVIPGSHKSNFAHPHMEQHRMKPGGSSVDGTEGAIHVHLDAGDALVFVDGISHGSAKRTNDGERRVIIFRYGPSWGNFRHGYSPSPELLERLTPARRKIVQPLDLIPRPTK